MSDNFRVGLQLSIGGLGDQSFNDSAFAGLEAAEKIHNFNFELATWQESLANTESLEKWAITGYDLIIGVGFHNQGPINTVAARFPDCHFALIDIAGQGANVWSATYREYEGDFVVGVLAALVTKTRIVGFMGGGITPVVRRIEAGFGEGVKYVDPTISVISDYVGEFDDKYKGRILAETQYSLGVDVLYQVAGRCGLGAIEAAKKFKTWIISTGSDHSSLAPENVLTSRIKDVGRPIKEIIGAAIEGHFEGGVTKSYGFAEGGLTLATICPQVSTIVTPQIQTKMQEIQAQIISGKLQVNLDE